MTASAPFSVVYALRMLAQAIDFAEAEGSFSEARNWLHEVHVAVDADVASRILTQEDVWGTFSMDTLTHPSKGMMVARGCGKVDDKYFRQSDKDKAVADIPELCPIWGDVLPYKSVTVVFDARLESQVRHWLTYVHGSDCVSDRKELEDGRVALRSDYRCW